METKLKIENEVRKSIREIPNFPKEGIMFKDITPLLMNAQLSKGIVEELRKNALTSKIDVVVGVESRGFLFGLPLAMALNVPFVPIRKKGKLPHETVSHKYDLEYGSAEIEMHIDAIQPGQNVMIHDDLLATGGTAAASAELIQKIGGNVAGFSFLVNLSFLNGIKILNTYSNNVYSLVNY